MVVGQWQEGVGEKKGVHTFAKVLSFVKRCRSQYQPNL